MKIITHRGLDPDIPGFFTESSLEAFKNHLERGFGIEFDTQFSKDNQVIIFHDSNLSRLTLGRQKENISEVNSKQITKRSFCGYHITSLEGLVKLLIKSSDPKSLSAIHIKHSCQSKEKIDLILEKLRNINYENYVIFDLNIETARYVHEKNSKINIAASVSHEYDIKRFNTVVGGTLFSISEVIKNKNIFTWAWLDEWDRKNFNHKRKSLYNKENFRILRRAGINIAVVSPELHRTSPGLLGNESHEDAQNRSVLTKRIKQIIDLKPDAICTDYPDLVKSML